MPSLTGIEGDVLFSETRFTSFFAPKLVSVDGYVWVEDSSLPDDFTLPALEMIGGHFTVARSDVLRPSFPALWRVGGGFSMESNHNLEELSGFQVLAELGDILWVTDNRYLPTCEAELLRDSLVANGFTGEVKIDGNGAGTSRNCD